MLTAWPGVDHAVVLAVGPHDRSSTDVYDILLRALDLVVPATTATNRPVVIRMALRRPTLRPQASSSTPSRL